MKCAQHVPRRSPAVRQHQKYDAEQRRESQLHRDKDDEVPAASMLEIPEVFGELLPRERGMLGHGPHLGDGSSLASVRHGRLYSAAFTG